MFGNFLFFLIGVSHFNNGDLADVHSNKPVLRPEHINVIFKKDLKYVGFVRAENCDFTGNDLTWYKKTAEQCADYCLWWKSQCSHWTWKEGYCYLKTGRVHFMDAHPIFNTRSACGVHCNEVQSEECRRMLSEEEFIAKFFDGPPTRMLRATECTFNRSPPAHSFYNATLTLCVNECRRMSMCTHFTLKNGVCKMFPGYIDSADVLKCDSSDCYCGFDCQSLNNDVCRSVDAPDFIIQNPMLNPLINQEQLNHQKKYENTQPITTSSPNDSDTF